MSYGAKDHKREEKEKKPKKKNYIKSKMGNAEDMKEMKGEC